MLDQRSEISFSLVKKTDKRPTIILRTMKYMKGFLLIISELVLQYRTICTVYIIDNSDCQFRLFIKWEKIKYRIY